MNYFKGIFCLLSFFLLAQCSNESQKDSNEVVLAWENRARSLDPRFALDANSQYLEDLVHCSLVEFDANGKVVYSLAESIEWFDSGKRLRLKIKNTVQFQDKTPVTIDDVVASLKYYTLKDLEETSPRKGFMDSVTRVEKTGERSFEIHFSKADASFLTNLIVAILPASLALKGQKIIDLDTYSSCGAFRLDNSASNETQDILLRPNENYSLGRIPQLGVRIKVVQDENTRFAKLVSGEIDFVQNGVSKEKLQTIKKSYSNQLKIQKKPGLNLTYLGFNARDEILSKPQVRRAISLAVNRELIIDKILHGQATIAHSVLTPNDPFFLAAQKTSFDPSQANKLLDEAGFKKNEEGIRFSLSYKTTTNATRVSIAKAVAQQLAVVGIKIKVESLEWGKFKSDVEKGNVQIWSLSWIGFKDPNILHYIFSSNSCPPQGGNRGCFSNKSLDGVLDQIVGESNFEKRKRYVHEAQKIIAQLQPYALLWHEDTVAVYSKKLQDFELYVDGRLSSLNKVSYSVAE